MYAVNWKKHGLIPATDKERNQTDKVFPSGRLSDRRCKSQIASVVRHLPNYYQYQTLGEYNALLSLFNITAEKIEGELQERCSRAYYIFPLNEKAKEPASVQNFTFGKKRSFRHWN